jgi:hypothetical protein
MQGIWYSHSVPISLAFFICRINHTPTHVLENLQCSNKIFPGLTVASAISLLVCKVYHKLTDRKHKPHFGTVFNVSRIIFLWCSYCSSAKCIASLIVPTFEILLTLIQYLHFSHSWFRWHNNGSCSFVTVLQIIAPTWMFILLPFKLLFICVYNMYLTMKEVHQMDINFHQKLSFCNNLFLHIIPVV